MKLEDKLDRIPTINESTHKQKAQRSLIDLDVEFVVKRIKRTKDLSNELDEIGINLRGLSSQIALYLHYKKKWKETHTKHVRARKNRDQANYRMKKADPEKMIQLNRQTVYKLLSSHEAYNYLRPLIKTQLKKFHADHENARVRSKTKEREYLHDFIKNLNQSFKNYTHQPYKYIVAIFNLFNFHAENNCNRCEFLDSKTGMCRKRKIFTCPKAPAVRKKLYVMAEKYPK
jgi:hypothetical protein